MRRLLGITLLLLISPPPVLGDAAPAIDVFVNAASPITRLSAAELTELYNGSRSTWGNGKSAVPFNLPSTHALRIEFDRVVLDMSPDEVGRFWIDQRVRGGSHPPRQVDESSVIVKLVAKLPGGIGYAPAAAAIPTDVRVVARIRNRKVIEP